MAILVPTILLWIATFSLSSSVCSSSKSMMHGFSVLSWYPYGNFHFSTQWKRWCIYLLLDGNLNVHCEILDDNFSLSYQMNTFHTLVLYELCASLSVRWQLVILLMHLLYFSWMATVVTYTFIFIFTHNFIYKWHL